MPLALGSRRSDQTIAATRPAASLIVPPANQIGYSVGAINTWTLKKQEAEGHSDR
jgi:hypothetical protein